MGKAITNTWSLLNRALTTLILVVISIWLTWFNWEQPWMEPKLSVKIDNDRAMISFVGIVNRTVPRGEYGAELKVDLGAGVQETVCKGGYDPSNPPRYGVSEQLPQNKPVDWWIENVDLERYPGGCEAQLIKGRTNTLFVYWSNSEGDVAEASVSWVQP